MAGQLFVTEMMNRAVGAPVASMLQAMHIHLQNLQAPISNPVAMQFLVLVFLLILFLIVRSRLSVDNPGALQHIFEGAHNFIQGQSEEIIGHHSEGYTPFLMALALFILICNLIGLIPGFTSPTAEPIVPLGCAIVAFLYYQAQGFKHAGIK